MPITDIDRRRSRDSREQRELHLAACYLNRVGLNEGRTTPAPIVDVTELVPELRGMARTTLRLHPRFGDEPSPDASKLGGHFIWPDGERWPTCSEHGIPYITVLQLRQEDSPATSFSPGKDLLQLLWCPLDHEAWTEPIAFWRTRSHSVRWTPRCPLPEEAILDYVPVPCLLMPEQVVEFPSPRELPPELTFSLREKCSHDSRILDVVPQAFGNPYRPFDPSCESLYAVEYYEYNLSVCPSTKVGGYVHWIQHPDVPACRCGREMKYLLTLV